MLQTYWFPYDDISPEIEIPGLKPIDEFTVILKVYFYSGNKVIAIERT